MGAVLVLAVVPAPGGSGEADLPPAFGVTMSRVAVDIVVRDKEGGILRGLAKGDVEVYEDGVRQGAESLQFVERSLDPGPPAAAASPEEPPLLALVLDGLSAESRRAVLEAALVHLGRPSRARPLVGLFAIDRGLRTLQAFTGDSESLRRALERRRSAGSTGFSGLREREDVRHAHAGLADGSPQTSALPAELAGEPECRLEGDDLVRRFKVLQSRMTESFDVLERDQRGAASLNALLALVDGLGAFPGRKAVMLFSEGLSLPSGVEASLRSLVAAANRAGVSVYAADAMGLRARSVSAETRRSLETLRTRLEMVQSLPTGTRGPGAAEMGDSGLALLERTEDALRFAPESGLSRLADQTGGFLLHGTNDLGAALLRIEEDLGAHYLLSYTPSNPELDGRFRSIQVRVTRPHGSVQWRQGYFAVRSSSSSPVLESEARALARLDRGELPTDVPLRLRVLQYPEAPASLVVPIVAEVAAGAFVSEPEGRGKARRRDFTILAVVRDGKGEVVAKASQRYALPSSGKDAGPVLFYREARLPPGRYTVEVMAQDALSTRAGGARVSLDLEAPAPGRLRASSLIRVGRAERLEAGDERAPLALRYQDVLVYPELAEAPWVRDGQPVVLFLTAWPTADRPDVDARVDVLRGGRILQTLPAGRHAMGKDGRVQIASSLSASGLQSGDYELQLTLTDGRDTETRSASLHVPR
jgi:VWFA-related protein